MFQFAIFDGRDHHELVVVKGPGDRHARGAVLVGDEEIVEYAHGNFIRGFVECGGIQPILEAMGHCRRDGMYRARRVRIPHVRS